MVRAAVEEVLAHACLIGVQGGVEAFPVVVFGKLCRRGVCIKYIWGVLARHVSWLARQQVQSFIGAAAAELASAIFHKSRNWSSSSDVAATSRCAVMPDVVPQRCRHPTTASALPGETAWTGGNAQHKVPGEISDVRVSIIRTPMQIYSTSYRYTHIRLRRIRKASSSHKILLWHMEIVEQGAVLAGETCGGIFTRIRRYAA